MKLSPSLIPRAALVRLRSLDLGGLSDYYMSSSAESSSTLIAAAPETTNMYVVAYGDKEGLAPGERLEAYGSTVRLVRTMAYGCPRGVTPASVVHGAISRDALADITRQLNRVDALYHEPGPSGTQSGTAGAARRVLAAAEKMNSTATTATNTAESADDAADVWQLVRITGQADPSAQGPVSTEKGVLHTTEDSARKPSVSLQRTSSSNVETTPEIPWDLPAAELEKRLRQMRRSNVEVIAAEWKRRVAPPTLITPLSGEAHDDLLVENGVCYASPEEAGLRVLRSARLAFMSMIERNANSVREAQHRRAVEERRPLVVLDVNGIDFSFSHAAVQATAEMGLHDESQCMLNFIPLTRRAAKRAEGSMAKFVRQIARAPGIPHDDPFTYVSMRHMDVAAFTTYLDLPSYGANGVDGGNGDESHESRSKTVQAAPSREQTPARRSAREAAFQLARTLSTVRTGAPVLVSFVPTPRSAAAIYAQVSQSRRAEVAMEARTVLEAKACVAEAISRSGRWGYITDEVLPMADCAQGGAVSLVVTVH